MKSQTEASTPGDSRRGWLHKLGIGGLLAGVTGMGYAFVRSLVPNVLYEEPQRSADGIEDKMQAQKNIWRKLTWTWKPESERDAGDSVVRNLLLHWFPAKVTIGSLSFRYSFWLGTISAVLFAILCVTGVPLM